MSDDRKIEIFDFNAEEEELTTKEFELDKNTEYITGFILTSDKDAQLFYRGKFRLEIGGVERIPENFEAKLVMCGINVPPNRRQYFVKNLPVGNGMIKIHYTDTDHANAPFESYRVSIYIYTKLKSC